MDSSQENVSPTFMSVPRVSNKRKSYTIEDKLFFIELISGGRKTQSEICNEYNICHSTLGTILSNKEKILRNYENNELCALRKRNRGSKHEDIERLLLDWYKEVSSKDNTINGTVMRAKANEFALLLNKQHEFKASNGWFHRFKMRNNLQFSSCSSSISGDDESLFDKLENKKARKDTLVLNFTQSPKVLSKESMRVYKPIEFALKTGSLSHLDEEEEEGEFNFTDEFTSSSNSNQENKLNQLYDDEDHDDKFNESECFQANSFEVPNKQEALNYLYKLRSFFDSTEKVSATTMKSLDDIENELLNG